MYYVIPLSTMVTIVRHKDASSIYLPLAATAILNGGMWTIYGLVSGLECALSAPPPYSPCPTAATLISSPRGP